MGYASGRQFGVFLLSLCVGDVAGVGGGWRREFPPKGIKQRVPVALRPLEGRFSLARSSLWLIPSGAAQSPAKETYVAAISLV